MPQVNDYDKFAAERQADLKQGKKFVHRFVEKPAMENLLPPLAARRVLMLGCGTGEESALLEKHGAHSMTGIDLSAESIRIAKQTYPAHTFTAADMHDLPFEDGSFDFVYSSLTVHYSSHPLEVYKEVFRVLSSGGVFQFSVGHPIRWASERVTIDEMPTKLLGYSEDEQHPKIYGNYSDFRQYEETYPNGETLQYWIGPPSMHFGQLREAGFVVTDFVETRAVEASKEVDQYYFERFSTFPQHAIYSATKP